MPILGVIASSYLQATGSYESIASTILTGTSATIEFSSIPQTYSHLQLRCSVVTQSTGAVIGIRMNSDTGNNYTGHGLIGDCSSGGTTPTAVNNTGMSYARIFGQQYGTQTTKPAVMVMDLPNYTSTNIVKTTRTISGFNDNTGGEIAIFASSWNNTAAVTNIRVILNSGGNFAAGSMFALYGIKDS